MEVYFIWDGSDDQTRVMNLDVVPRVGDSVQMAIDDGHPDTDLNGVVESVKWCAVCQPGQPRSMSVEVRIRSKS